MDTDFESLMMQKIVTGEALLAWQRFKDLHPNTPENPDYSEASVKRWLYHINEAEKNKGFEKVELDTKDISFFRENYRVQNWCSMNMSQISVYSKIAECFPGVEVWACGSQMRGDHISAEHYDERIVDARRKAGMRTDRMSDFDFWVHPNAQPVKELPINADRYRGKFNEKEMVAIPIYYGDV